MDFSSIAIFVGISVLAISSYFDFKTREVENYITVGFIFLALAMQLGYSFLLGDLSPFLNSLFIGALFFAFGWVMFQTGQWGGADTKLLTGMGVLFANFAPVASWPFAATLFVNIFIAAFGYTILYSVYLTWQEPSVLAEFKRNVRKESGELHLVFGIAFLAFALASGFVVWTLSPDIFLFLLLLKPLLLLLALIPVFWCMIKFARALEDKTLRLKRTAAGLREFDLLIEDILLVGRKIKRVPEKECTREMKRSATKVIYDSRDPDGMSLEQISKIKKLVSQKKLKNSFVIKWGLPFVPVFLIGLLLTLYFGDILALFI